MAGSPAAVAAELNALSAKGGALHTDASHCTNTMYASTLAVVTSGKVSSRNTWVFTVRRWAV